MPRAALAVLLAAVPAAAQPAAQPAGFAPPADAAAVVYVFFGHDCPMSNGYAPELARLHAAYAPKGVAFRLVYADADLSAAAAKKHADEYRFPFPAARDPGLALARKLGATVKPEAVVVAGGAVAYRGRIDDINADFGRRRAAPTRRELKAALDDILAGRPVAVPRAAAIGCDIHFPDAGGRP